MKESKIVFDASVLTKLFLREKDSNEVKELIENFYKENYLILEPVFLKTEIYSILAGKLLRTEINQNDFEEALYIFLNLDIQYFDDSNLLDKSLKIAVNTKLPTIYDSIYLTLALEQNALLITADQKFINSLNAD